MTSGEGAVNGSQGGHSRELHNGRSTSVPRFYVRCQRINRLLFRAPLGDEKGNQTMHVELNILFSSLEALDVGTDEPMVSGGYIMVELRGWRMTTLP